jgi:hypothetical protein
LTSEGVKPDPEKVRAEEAMSPPENKSEQLKYLGFINYLTKFIPYMSEVSANLRQLLENNTLWHWDEQGTIKFSKAQNYDYKCSHSSVLRSKVTVDSFS